jgi:hypothetical protein
MAVGNFVPGVLTARRKPSGFVSFVRKEVSLYLSSDGLRRTAFGFCLFFIGSQPGNVAADGTLQVAKVLANAKEPMNCEAASHSFAAHPLQTLALRASHATSTVDGCSAFFFRNVLPVSFLVSSPLGCILICPTTDIIFLFGICGNSCPETFSTGC